MEDELHGLETGNEFVEVSLANFRQYLTQGVEKRDYQIDFCD